MRPEGRRATHASDPPPTLSVTLAIPGVPTRHGSNAGSPVLVIQYIHSVQSSQQPLRLRAGGWATNGRLLCPRLRTAGPRLLPTTCKGGRCPRPPPRAASPTQSHATRGGPIQTRPLRAPTPRRFPTETSHACRGEIGPRRTPDLPERPRGAEGKSGGLTPPPWVPRSRAETSATSAERRRTRPPFGVVLYRSRVCPGSPRCLFTGKKTPGGDTHGKTGAHERLGPMNSS